MADEKRPSARQAAPVAPGNRASNRSTAPVAAAKPSGSGVRSGVAARPSGSGIRQAPPVVAPPPPPPPPPTRSPSVQRRSAGAPVLKKKQALPMKEILIAAGVLIGILALALTIGYFKGSGVSEKEKEHQAQVQILERNVKSATDELKKAVDIGASYCIGKEPGETKDVAAKLLAPFKGNAKIYNVFFNKDFKDKKQTEKHEQVALVDDQEHRTLDELNKLMPEEKESKDMKDVSVKYALAREGDKRIPVIIAKKVIRAAKEELVNMGGQITVIVRAEEDNFFHAALQKTFEDPKTETKPAGTEAKK